MLASATRWTVAVLAILASIVLRLNERWTGMSLGFLAVGALAVIVVLVLWPKLGRSR